MFGRCTGDNDVNDDLSNPRKCRNNSRHSIKTYCDIEHADIYKIVSDNTLTIFYPGIQIKEPSLHNIKSNEGLPPVPSKQSKSFWTKISNLVSKLSNKKSQKQSKKRRSIPPPPRAVHIRRFNRKIPPPPPRKIKVPIEPNQMIPPPVPRDAVPPPPPSDAKAHNLPSLNKALLSDIHKGKKLQSIGNAVEIKNGNIGPSIRRDPKTSCVRKSLLRQIEQGKLLRKSSLQLSNAYGIRASTGMRENLTSQLESRRQYFDEDQDVRSSLSRSSSVWMD